MTIAHASPTTGHRRAVALLVGVGAFVLLAGSIDLDALPLSDDRSADAPDQSGP